MYAEQVLKCTKCNNLKSESEFYNYKHEHRCKACISEIRKSKYKVNPQKERDRANRYRKANPDNVKHTKLMQTYQISLETYTGMSNEQNHVCAICKKPETTIWKGKILKLATDHNKVNGRVRGLLCMKCNRALGLLGENIDSMEAMIEYKKKDLKLG